MKVHVLRTKSLENIFPCFQNIGQEELTQKRGANVFRYLIARLARLTQMRQFFVQHTFELKRDGRSGDVADEYTRSIKIDKKRNPQID